MASQVVQMDYPVITSVSQNFGQASEALVAIGQVLQVTITMLRTAAFFGMELAGALAQYLEVIKAKVDKLAGLTKEFSGDLARAVNDHRTGQYQAGSYFGEGIN
jgi:hypothetical protein